MFEWKGLRMTVRFTGAHKQYLLRKIRLHIVHVCFYIIAWKMVSFIQLYIHRRSMFACVDAKRNCPRIQKFSTRYAQSNTCQLSFWQSKIVHNVSPPNIPKEHWHTCIVRRKKMGDTVRTMTSKISLCIYIWTLIRVFDFPYSEYLGSTDCMCEQERIQSAQSDPGCPVRRNEILTLWQS